MKFALECIAGEMSRALGMARSVTDGGLKVPILKAVRIEVGKAGAEFAATNTDHSIRTSVAAAGRGIIHADTATLAVKAAALRPNQPVTLTGEDDGKYITMVQGKTRWRVPVLLGDGFPVDFTKGVKGKTIKVAREPFFAALAITQANVVPDISRSVGMGVFLDMGEERFRVVSAARHGLYIVELDAPRLPVNIIVPSDSSRAIREIFKEADELTLTCQDAEPFGGNFVIEADGILYRTKLIGQEFANWRDAYAKQTGDLAASCVVDRGQILEALRRTAAIAEDHEKMGSYVGITMTVADGELTFSAKNRSGEEGTDTCPAEGDPGRFATSAYLFETALANLIGDRLRIHYRAGDETGPALLEPEPKGERDDCRLIMPMRV